jgi:hypothetical protein
MHGAFNAGDLAEFRRSQRSLRVRMLIAERSPGSLRKRQTVRVEIGASLWDLCRVQFDRFITLTIPVFQPAPSLKAQGSRPVHFPRS